MLVFVVVARWSNDLFVILLLLGFFVLLLLIINGSMVFSHTKKSRPGQTVVGVDEIPTLCREESKINSVLKP
jgi:hypothetical protein